jgi:hypothetical protein
MVAYISPWSGCKGPGTFMYPLPRCERCKGMCMWHSSFMRVRGAGIRDLQMDR